jgi:hypothetical protein
MYRYSLDDFSKLTSNLRRTEMGIQLPLLGGFSESEAEEMKLQSRRIGDCTYLVVKKTRTGDRFLKEVDRLLPIIDPMSYLLLFWNLLLMVTIIYNFAIIPIVIFIINYVYGDPYEASFMRGIDIGILALYLVDMLFIRWRIGCWDVGDREKGYKALYWRYFTTIFPFDLVAFLGYLIFVAFYQIIYIKLVFYLKVVSLLAMDQQVDNQICMHPIRYSIYRLFRLVAMILLVTNFTGCVFFVIDYQLYNEQGFYYENGLLWLTGSEATQNMDMIATWPWYVWYEYGLYFAVMSTSTCGYGNVTARNPQEILFTLVVILVNLAIFSYFTSGMITIIQDFRWKETIRKGVLSSLTQAIHMLKISEFAQK